MKPTYLKEFERYSKTDLQEIFKCQDTNAFKILINELRERRILENDMNVYKFKYVGFLEYMGNFYFVFPKFIPFSLFHQYYPLLTRLLKEYSEREKLEKEEIETFGEIGIDSESNIFKIVHFLIADYLENGLYTNEKKEIEINGEGDVDWNTTVETNIAYLSRENLVYLDLLTHNTINDEEDFIRKTHMYVLNECISTLKKLEILNALNLPEIHYEVDSQQLGETDYILNRIEIERSAQFNDRKLKLLSALYDFLSKESNYTSENSLYLFGTRSFEYVWEKVCGFVIGNDFMHLKKVIPHPIWKDYHTGNKTLKPTFRPDILKSIEERRLFFIFDAKYYNTSFNSNGEVTHNSPGIEDISKQYLYEKIYRDHYKNKYLAYYNIFLFPSVSSDTLIGEVRLNLFVEEGPVFLLSLDSAAYFESYIKRLEKPEEYFTNLTTNLDIIKSNEKRVE